MLKNIFKGVISHAKVDGHHNLVVQNVKSVYTGLTYTDAKAIATDVFNENFYRVTEAASKLVKSRLEEFNVDLLSEVQHARGDFDQFADPGMQYALFSAQQEYAKSGDATSKKLLIDLLVQRASQDRRNLNQIVLNEAINVSGKITPEQMALMALNFTCRVRINGFSTRQAFESFLSEVTSKVSDALQWTREEVRYQFDHLAYAGCVSSGSLASDFVSDLQYHYDLGFNNWNDQENHGFQDFFKRQFIPGSPPLEKILANSENKTFITLQDFEAYAMASEVNPGVITIATDELKKNVYARESIEKLLFEPPYAEISEIYDRCSLGGYDLTTVGLCIAKSYLRTHLGFDFQ